jgi:hypothetical protein
MAGSFQDNRDKLQRILSRVTVANGQLAVLRSDAVGRTLRRVGQFPLYLRPAEHLCPNNAVSFSQVELFGSTT